MKLTKNPESKPNFELIHKNISDLESFLGQEPLANEKWVDDFQSVLDFQDEDGSFKLIDTFNIESDCRIAYCYYPTYICTAIMIKAYLKDKRLIPDIAYFKLALEICCIRGLKGQGVDDINGMVQVMNIFIQAGIREFIEKNYELCPKFSYMITRIYNFCIECLENKKCVFNFGENHEDDFRRISNGVEPQHLVFVYGTLLRGERNHKAYLGGSKWVGKAELEGFAMYDLGCFPGLKEKRNEKVKGELYCVNKEMLHQIDCLEGEGSLYKRKTVEVQCGNDTLNAFVYVYNRPVCDNAEIPYEKQPYCGNRENYVWYVAYGSNLSLERFMLYIKGGNHPYSGNYRSGCSNNSAPKRIENIIIPYRIYFGWYSNSWGGSAIAYLNTTESGQAFGRAYLVTKEQYKDIRRMEGLGDDYYDMEVRLEDIDGIPAYTITNHKKHLDSIPSKEYLKYIRDGLKEMYPSMNGNTIDTYLEQKHFDCFRWRI